MPPIASDDLLAALSGVMREGGWRWYVFGAQAVIAHGIPRMTNDVDVTCALDDADRERFVAAMEAEGFRSRAPDDRFVARTRVMPFYHDASGMFLDVVIAGPGLEELFLSRVVDVRFGSTRVPLISPEDLVVTKILAGRPKDLDDAKGVMRQPGLDLEQVRDVLRQLESALGQSDLLPALGRLLRDGP